MFTPDEYQLLDFGQGRKLERFGDYILDRPAPAAEGVARRDPAAWREANARYDRTSGESGCWSPTGALPERWTLGHGVVKFEISPTPFGHLGIFPEQAVHWDWIDRQVRRIEQPLRVLNLFAYTGGSTLAAVAAGASVTHVDAAKNMVAWARRNAEASGLVDRPIRWIAEDTMKFVRRELRRGNRYDAVILDPPSFGHGPKGEVWRMEDDFPALLQLCCDLTDGKPAFLVMSCHTPGFDAPQLGRLLHDTLGDQVETDELSLESADGRQLPSGVAARLVGR